MYMTLPLEYHLCHAWSSQHTTILNHDPNNIAEMDVKYYILQQLDYPAVEIISLKQRLNTLTSPLLEKPNK